ncbi:hypothetical protein C4580_03045 [Candidatus Woesearchaeota archaeon]|nr:MAG: hypothetical protein C4580_03045 [Candidatus Woesearchaeota archaeon]
MNRLSITALVLLIFIVACAPALPARNQTMNATEPVVVMNETEEVPVPVEQVQEENETVSEPAPNLQDVPRKEVVEGETVSFPNLRAVDPDGDPIEYTFSAPLDEKGVWRTKDGDAGEHLITITASDGTNTVTQQVLIVVQPKNKPPIIELEEPVEVSEGEMLTLNPTVSDPDGDNVTLSYSGWMTSNVKNVSFDDSGLHKVIISATDGKAVTTREVIVSVENVNRAPTIFDLDPVTVKEGQRVIVKPAGKDPDGDTVRFEFEEPIGPNGTWNTEIGDAGEYELLVIATDGELTAETLVSVFVEAVNKPPTIELASPIEVNEGDQVVLEPIISDPEGDEVRVSYSGWMSANTRLTTYDDAGNHKVTITARDTADNEARLEVIVVVNDLNRPPIFGAGSFN